MAVQIIDDKTGATLVSASTLDKDLRAEFKYGGNKDAAVKIGKDHRRAGFGKGNQRSRVRSRPFALSWSGCVAADAAREGGLSF